MMLIVGCSCLLLYDTIYLLKMAFDDLQWCMILGSFYAMLGFIAIIHSVYQLYFQKILIIGAQFCRIHSTSLTSNVRSVRSKL